MMRVLINHRSLPVILILSLLCLCCNISEARHHHQKHPSAVVVGAVFCDTCFQGAVPKGSHYISGATVAVECAEGSTRPAFHQEVTTDKQGSFRVHLPFSVSKHVKEIEGCTVKLVKSSEPYCSVASTASSSLIRLKEKKGGKHIYSAGFFTFKPLKQPGLCNQQPSVTKSQLDSLGDMLPPLPNTDIPGLITPELPPLPTLPLPTLPVPLPMVPTTPNAPLLPNLPIPTPSLPIPQLPNMPSLPIPPLSPLSGQPIKPTDKPTNIPQKTLNPSEVSKVENGQVSQPQFLFFPPLVGNPPAGLVPGLPNPLNPPPLIPNPLQPPATPLLPNPFQPPTPPAGLIPGVPGLPNVPGLPTIPGMPTIPGIPTIPTVPGFPTIPGIPNIPGIPGIPALTPPSPPPPASLLPPLLPPGLGLPLPPAAKKAAKVNP